MFCPNCGFELDGDLRYCTECGYALEDAKAVLNSASNEVAEEPSVINEAAEEIFASDETEKEPSAGAEAGGGKVARGERARSGRRRRPAQGRRVVRCNAFDSSRARRPAKAEQSGRQARRGASPCACGECIRTEKGPKALYIVGIIVGLAAIAIFSYLLFFSKSSDDVAHYGQDKAIVVAQESKITPTDAKGEKIKKYSVTLNGDNGYSTNAEVKGDEGFTVSQLPDIKPGKYTLTVKDSKTKVEWSVPVEVVDNSKSDEAVKDVSLEVPKADSADAKADEGDKKDGNAAADNAAASAAYKQKCQEYLARYGEPQMVEIEDYMSALRGFCLADLVDFDNDGVSELVTVVNDMSADDMKSAWDGNIEELQKSYTVEVWSAEDGGIKRIYSQKWLDNSNGGSMYLPLVKDDEQNVLLGKRTYEMCDALKAKLSGKQITYGDNWSLFGKKDDSLSLVLNREAWSVSVSGGSLGDYYASNGKEISEKDFNALNSYTDFNHQYCTYYFVDFSSSSQGSFSDVPVVGCSQMSDRTNSTLKKLGIE